MQWWPCLLAHICVARLQWVNSLAPGRSWSDFKNVIFNLAFLIGIFKSSYDDILRWMPQGLTDDKSTLIQVMAWCRQATSHYLNQCWLRSPMPYGVTRPQWVKYIIWLDKGSSKFRIQKFQICFFMKTCQNNKVSNKALRERQHPSAPISLNK